jgi:hypothetical protein
MSRTPVKDGLSDIDARLVAEAEADLDRLLSIEPSADFAAKVLARIREPHAGHGWRAGWVGLALASAAALLIALTLRDGPPVRDRVATSPSPPHQDIAPSGATSDARGPVSLSDLPAPAAAPGRTRPAAHRLEEPEVLIDTSLADAIRRLVVSTRDAPLDETVLDGSPQPASAAPLPSVVVEPLTVPELVLKPADQTGGRSDALRPGHKE